MRTLVDKSAQTWADVQFLTALPRLRTAVLPQILFGMNQNCGRLSFPPNMDEFFRQLKTCGWQPYIIQYHTNYSKTTKKSADEELSLATIFLLIKEKVYHFIGLRSLRISLPSMNLSICPGGQF